ncbi:MAG: NAD(P)H-hydrate epimerase [Chloroflexi bacterium]|nr:NAD(P)H-hydrate epimerase [Chloroflexota bacterium]
MPAISSEQMRKVDRLAIRDAGLSLPQLMENAGHSLARVVDAYLQRGSPAESGAAPQSSEEARHKPILVLAGNGGNGGGALAAARHLRNWGQPVQVALSAPPGNLSEATAQQLRTLHKDGLRALWPAAPEFDARFPEWLQEASLVVDGLIGYGLRGPLQGDPAVLVEAVLDRAPPVVVSLDVPSGFDASSGAGAASGVVATATVTLALPKTGLLQGDAAAAVGELLLADLGIPVYIYERLDIGGVRGLFASGPIQHLVDEE